MMRPPVAAAHRGALLLAALVWLGACGSETAPPLRIGLSPRPGYDFLYLAQEKGFFADEKLVVQLREFSSLGDVRRALERGQIDVAAGTLIELCLVPENSDCWPQVVLVAGHSKGADR